MASKNQNMSRTERDLIYLLLHYKECISDFIDSGLPVAIFTDSFRLLVSEIISSYTLDDVLLTRKTFIEKIKGFKVPKERIAQELIFAGCYASKTNIDDFPMLLKKLLDEHTQKSLNQSLDKLSQNVNSGKDKFSSIKQLIDDCQDIVETSFTQGVKTYYNDIRVYV